MPKPNLRAVNNENPSARDIAAQRVKRWRSNAEKEKLPVSNQDDSGAPSLRTDDILKRSEGDHLIGKK